MELKDEPLHLAIQRELRGDGDAAGGRRGRGRGEGALVREDHNFSYAP